ncbi:MAG: pentapeptide repeat-containing protein, partial [Rubrivivax sp.]|nr:pentapeptide repeat-containing protein [Rubrivivax sp.]
MALILACVYSYLTIATTTDAALLSNSNATPLPIIQVNVPIVWFYYFAPVILTVLFIYFHLYLERFWRCVARLPLRHPDGRGLDDYVYPWLISCAFIRGEIRQLSAAHRMSVRLEAWLSLLLGWGLVPIVLLFYWGRYVAAHDRWGTLLHVALVLLSAGFALRYLFTARNALRQMGLNAQAVADGDGIAAPRLRLRRRQAMILVAAMSLLAGALVYQSLAAAGSLSADDCEGVGADSGCAFYQPGRSLWQALGIEPYSEVRENRFVAKPADWQQLQADPARLRNYLDGQRALVLIGRDLRGMNAREAFMPGSRLSAGNLDFADLRHAVLTASRLEGLSLRGARLTDAELQHAVIVDSQFDDVLAEAARFGGVSFAASASGGRTRLSGDFSGASFEGARGDGLRFHTRDGVRNATSLREAVLSRVNFRWASFQRVDLGGARIGEATLTHSQFIDTDFSGATLRHSFFNFSVFTRSRFIATDLDDTLFIEARFVDTEIGASPRAGDAGAGAASRKRISGFQAVMAEFDAKSQLRDLHFER